MKTNLSLIRKAALVSLCAVVLSPATIFGANAPKTTAEDGIIKSVDSKTHQLVVTDTKTKADGTFQWNDKTKFTEHAKATSASALKSGQPIHINYAAGSGMPILERVQISAAKEHPTATGSTPHPKN